MLSPGPLQDPQDPSPHHEACYLPPSLSWHPLLRAEPGWDPSVDGSGLSPQDYLPKVQGEPRGGCQALLDSHL